ncbi:MAG: hypothetical protein LBK60_03995 [Verrucomicrobiales bacterium]|jgi:hypothetical protein|nr:hypothetical protein [Verrucomicrobiales bacterium]
MNRLGLMMMALTVTVGAAGQTGVILPSPDISYGDAERALAVKVAAGATVGELALVDKELPPPGDLTELATRWAVFSRAGFEAELEKLLPLLGRKWPLDDWYAKSRGLHGNPREGFYGALAEDLATHERWRLLRRLMELRPEVTSGARGLRQNWAASGGGVDAEAWLRQRLALAVEPVYGTDWPSPQGRNVWVRELLEVTGSGARSAALVAEWRERLRQGDFLAARDLICAHKFTAEMAAEFAPRNAAQALMMGKALTAGAPARALPLLDQALAMPFGAEEGKYIRQGGLAQQEPADYGTATYFRRMVLRAKLSAYERLKDEAGVAETRRLLKEGEPRRPRYMVRDNNVTRVIEEEPRAVEIHRLCDAAQEHARKQEWRAAFADYARALPLISPLEQAWRPAKGVDVTRDRDAVIAWAADCLERAGDRAAAVKFLREQLAALPPWDGDWTVKELCKLVAEINGGDEALLWRWLAGTGVWDDAVIRRLTEGRGPEEQAAVWRRLREVAGADLMKQLFYAQRQKDLALLERLARADWSASPFPWRKSDAVRALYELQCARGDWRAAAEWLPKIYSPMPGNGGLAELAKLAALADQAGDGDGALTLWRQVLAYDLCATPLLPQPGSERGRAALLKLHEESLAKFPDSAGLARTVEWLRKSNSPCSPKKTEFFN